MTKAKIKLGDKVKVTEPSISGPLYVANIYDDGSVRVQQYPYGGTPPRGGDVSTTYPAHRVTLDSSPVVTIKNFKYAEFASQETHCFQATVYVDGARFCIADNEGHGGPDRYIPLDSGKSGSNDRLLAAIRTVGKRANPKAADDYEQAKADRGDREIDWANYDREMLTQSGHSAYEVFEYLVAKAIETALYVRDMKRAFRGKWLFQKEPDGPLFQCRRLKEHKGETMQDIIRKQYPKARVLNIMPEAEAVEIWRAS